MAFDTNITITGEFNYNYSNISSRRKADSLFSPYGLVQFIDEPTHFTETSESIIDLLFTRNAFLLFLVVSVMLFLIKMLNIFVLYMQLFNFDKYKQLCFKIPIWKYDDGNYNLLKQYVRDFDWYSLKNDTIVKYLR